MLINLERCLLYIGVVIRNNSRINVLLAVVTIFQSPSNLVKPTASYYIELAFP